MFLAIFQHLLPNAKAWRITVDKQLRQFFDGLGAGLGDVIKLFYDGIYSDLNPQQTRELDAWEIQFGLPNTVLTTQERRDRLDAAWKAQGGQDPFYIQSTLQAAGFPVYVHKWWVPGSEAAVNVKSCATPRDPTLILLASSPLTLYVNECGEALAECGEALAECGEFVTNESYALVNRISRSERDVLPLCGEAIAACGEALATCGEFTDFRDVQINYIVPNDVTKWPYFLYFGDAVFGDIAQIPTARKNEFETLCLKICPAQQWLGILVEYT